MPEMEVGTISAFFVRPGVAGVELAAPLKLGDRLHIKGHTTNLELTVDSMQVENVSVQEAQAGQSVGVKVPDRVRTGDRVYQVTE